MITAVMIDTREPEWVKNLKFGGLPVMVNKLEMGDVWGVTDDGHTLMIERKTPDDFLGSLRDERLMPQLARLAEPRQAQQLRGYGGPTSWPYLVITDEFKRAGNKVYTSRETGWSWSALQGALLTIQEMGVQIVTCGGDEDFEACVLRLGQRNRAEVMNLLPPRQPVLWGPKEAFIASLPGIGPEKTERILQWAGGSLAHALIGLTDLSLACPVEGVGELTRKKISRFLGLNPEQKLDLTMNANDQVVMEISNE